MDATAGSLVLPQSLSPDLTPVPLQPSEVANSMEQVVQAMPVPSAAAASPQPGPVDRHEERPDPTVILASADGGSAALESSPVLTAPPYKTGSRGAGSPDHGEDGDPGIASASAEAPPHPARMSVVTGLADPDKAVVALPPDRAAAVTDRAQRTRAEPARQVRDRINPSAAGGVFPVASASSEASARQAELALPPAADIQTRPGTLALTATAPLAHAPQPVADAAVALSGPATPLDDAWAAPAAGSGVGGERSPVAQAAGVIRFLARGRDGAQTLVLRLDPEELGRVQISITRSPKGPASIAIRVEQPETLLLLMRDQGQLHRALDSAGIAPEGRQLSFQLAQVPAVAGTRDAATPMPTDAVKPMQQDAFNAGSGHAGLGQSGQSHDGRQSGSRRDPSGLTASGRDTSLEWNVALIVGPGQHGGGSRHGIDITA